MKNWNHMLRVKYKKKKINVKCTQSCRGTWGHSSNIAFDIIAVNAGSWTLTRYDYQLYTKKKDVKEGKEGSKQQSFLRTHGEKNEGTWQKVKKKYNW